MVIISGADNKNREIRVSMFKLFLSHGANVTLLSDEGLAAIHMVLKRASAAYISGVL